MVRRNRFVSAWLTGGALALGVGLSAGCGGGAPSDHVERPVVRAFSPFVAPINFGSSTLTQNPTFTNGFLTVSTDPAYREEEWRSNVTGLKVPPGTANSTNYGSFGRIVVFFNEGAHGTRLDASSILSADPADPLNHSALLVTKYTPGVGNEILGISGITVDATHIIIKPSNFSRVGIANPPTPLPDGQYTVRVGSEVRSVDGDRMDPAPVFLTFTVGAADAVQPFVVNTDPADQQINVGAGVPPPAAPTGVGASQIADVRTNIFGPTSPDIRIEFSEGVRKTSVNENNIQVIRAGIPTYLLPPAPGFPKLKSELDGETLPSNGHEAIMRIDPLVGGLPFQSAIQVTITGLWNTAAAKAAAPLVPQNSSPITDLAGNRMDLSYVFTFYTVAPPDVPTNPFPEFAIWWSAVDRVGAIDTVNQPALADQFNGAPPPPSQGIQRNVVPQYTDTVSNSQNIPGFSPTEMIIDGRTSAAMCNSYVYVLSPESNQLVIVNTSTSLPIALINTPSPGGIAGQFSQDGANVLLVTNSSANTFTIYDFSNITPGSAFLNGPIFIQRVVSTGNTPRAITISDSSGGITVADWNRDGGLTAGPTTPLVMWADYTDGNVSTHNLGTTVSAQRFALGAHSAPNDVVMTPCFGLNPILFGAISAGGSGVGQGKIHYYVAGPGCTTGTAVPARPDSLVGDLTGFDGPDGLDEVLSASQFGVFFVVAESGSQANRVTTLGVQTGANNLPRILNSFTAVGANPTNVAHRPAWQNPCIGPALDGFFDCPPFLNHDNVPTCIFKGTEQDVVALQLIDQTETTSQRLYICARGAGQVTVVNMLNGSLDYWGGVNPIFIQGVRRVTSTCSQ